MQNIIIFAFFEILVHEDGPRNTPRRHPAGFFRKRRREGSAPGEVPAPGGQQISRSRWIPRDCQ